MNSEQQQLVLLQSHCQQVERQSQWQKLQLEKKRDDVVFLLQEHLGLFQHSLPLPSCVHQWSTSCRPLHASEHSLASEVCTSSSTLHQHNGISSVHFFVLATQPSTCR